MQRKKKTYKVPVKQSLTPPPPPKYCITIIKIYLYALLDCILGTF